MEMSPSSLTHMNSVFVFIWFFGGWGLRSRRGQFLPLLISGYAERIPLGLVYLY